ncbi:MAG: glutaredoxin family protein [Anaerolineae bacterium]|nr:glutaredoxin family protein [Anaerolineae bacterium]
MKKSYLLFILPLLLLALFNIQNAYARENDPPMPVNVYFFWGDGCPHCAAEKPFLESLVEQYPQVKLHAYEIYYVEKNRELFKEFGTALDFEPQGVPTTIIGRQYWVGFREEYKTEIEAAIRACMQDHCEFDPGQVVLREDSDQVQKPSAYLINIPLIGVIDLGNQSLMISSAIIGFVDGFNPCSLWVLSVLLAITLHSGSRSKTLIVGLTFLLTTMLVYSLFITGVFTILSYVGYLKWIQALVAAIALIFGFVNLKDYFWYKEGVSFTISDKHKPKIYQNMRSTVANQRSTWGLIGSTVVLAIGVSLIEFACTAGFPVIWSNLVSSSNISAGFYILLLAVYMLIYLLDELVFFGMAVVSMKASRLEEKHGRLLKLISGVVMLVLGVVMLGQPELMNRMDTSLVVFGIALALSFLVLLIHQKLLPGFGIYIGTGLKKKQK